MNLLPYYAQQDSILRLAIGRGEVGAFLKANGAALTVFTGGSTETQFVWEYL